MSSRIAVLGAAILLTSTSSRAEVSVELNAAGRVTGLFVRADLESGSIWGKQSALPELQVLNPEGDGLGDRMPTCGILALPTQDAAKNPPRSRATEGAMPNRARTAIVAWPRFDGNDWEIVYSAWSYRTGTWTATTFVELGDNDTDDYDPRLLIKGNRVILLWRRSSGPDDFALTSAKLVAAGDSYELEWNPPVELTSPPGMSPDDFLELSLPHVLSTGLGGSTLSTRTDP